MAQAHSMMFHIYCQKIMVVDLGTYKGKILMCLIDSFDSYCKI